MKGARSILISFTASIMLGFGIPSIATAAATTWTVTSYGDDPDDASTLRGALHAAHDGDTIDLTSLTGAIVLTYGAAQVLRELPINASITIRGPGPDKLAIDGNKFSTVFHVFGVTVTISGLTIRNGVGTVDGVVGLGFGGGIRNSGALTLTDCTISGNSADGGGAAIFNLPGKTVAIDNCTLSNNTAVAIGEYDTVGGAIWNSSNDLSDPSLRVSGTVTVTNSTIANNSANGGAGIYNEGTLVVSDTTVSGNTATAGFEDLGVGGGIINDLFGSVTLTNVTVSNNSAEGLYGYGGGLVTSNVATVTGSTFSGNSPEAINNDTTLTLTNSTIWGNKRDGLVSLGFAPGNGYGYPQSSVTLVNSTIGANGGNGVSNGDYSHVYLRNTILARNAGGNCFNYHPFDPAATIASQDHNISDDTTCAIFLEQPNDFAPHTDSGLDNDLKDNGGPTKTVALTISSVGVDAIPPADCAVSTDQRGVSRPQGTNCDIGAYEAMPDFYFSPISSINATVGGSGTSNVQVNSFVGFDSTVTLATTSAPTGIATSFSPNPVTPPSYGSTSSTLSVNIGPAVTPATYTIGVKGSSGALNHSTSMKVVVAVTTVGVTQVVNADLAAGCIDNSGVANAVTTKLAQAQADIDAGDTADARTILNDLLSLLQAQRGKHIKTTCTVNSVTFDPDAVLIADVQALLASL